jgi:hypothetical protein
MKARNGTIRNLNAIHFKMSKITRISEGQGISDVMMALQIGSSRVGRAECGDGTD